MSLARLARAEDPACRPRQFLNQQEKNKQIRAILRRYITPCRVQTYRIARFTYVRHKGAYSVSSATHKTAHLLRTIWMIILHCSQKKTHERVVCEFRETNWFHGTAVLIALNLHYKSYLHKSNPHITTYIYILFFYHLYRLNYIRHPVSENEKTRKKNKVKLNLNLNLKLKKKNFLI